LSRDSRVETPLAPLFGVALRPLQAFFRLEAASGILLLASAVAALLWANLDAASYHAFAELPVALSLGGWGFRLPLVEVVNDGLMTIFFFVVGMEIKRELVLGELKTRAQAILPAVAAAGGMIVPAAIYAALNLGTPGLRGWGIPMATDIAFAIGVLTLLRARVPNALVVFLTALAIFDDMGGILVIALFYGEGLHLGWLAAAAGVLAVLLAMSRAQVGRGAAWLAGGIALWYAVHHAGIHATIAGVLVGLAIPARARRLRGALEELGAHVRKLLARPPDDEALEAAEVLRIEEKLEDVEAPLTRFEHLLHPWVAFGVMPLFALVNSGVALRGMDPSALLGDVALGAAAGLVLGKLIGIFSFTFAAVRLGLAPMPGGASAAKLLGVSLVAGIGFTVATFIATLAFPGDASTLDQAKLGILAGSLVAGVAGALVLRATPRVAAEERRADPAAAAG
jgi:NhaA family Na+:H+ antiporter